ncbi:VOC family protein [Mucilaginibacter sp.]|uniref:VOC family protein n=1 Tax=Mucilaginibacter sp. TaxID=1882438 RepID=UPI0035BBC2FB
MQSLISIAITGIQHVGIPVTDIQTSQAFYNRLGFINVMQASFGAADARGTCIMMQRDTIVIELYQLPEPELQEIGRRDNGHIDHIAFNVPDIDAAYAAISSAGLNIIEPEPVFLQFWERGCKYFNITGPDGERLEFNQRL